MSTVPISPAPPAVLGALGRNLYRRPRPTLVGSLTAVGGVLVAGGIAGLVGDSMIDDPRPAAAIIALVLGFLGYGLLVTAHDPLAPAGIALVAAVPALAAGALTVSSSTTSATPTLLLAGVGWAAMWLVPISRRPLLLGLGVAAGWLVVVSAAAGDLTVGVDQDQAVWASSLVVGTLYLVACLLFDRWGWHGFATPIVAVGDIAFVVGASGAVGELEDVGGSILVICAATCLLIVGNEGGRRFTMWLGAFGVLGGITGLVGSAVDGDDPTAQSLLAVAIGAALLVGVWIRHQSVPREPGLPPPAPAPEPLPPRAEG